MKWEHSEKYNGKDEAPKKLNIPEPPCKHCVYWHPHIEVKLIEDGLNTPYWANHFFACIAAKMYKDFSCYRLSGRVNEPK